VALGIWHVCYHQACRTRPCGRYSDLPGRKAKQAGIVNIASSNAARRAARDHAEKEGIETPHGAVVVPAAEVSGP
jgi:hypothetical protein